jgi:hypothetical protein
MSTDFAWTTSVPGETCTSSQGYFGNAGLMLRVLDKGKKGGEEKCGEKEDITAFL